MLRSTEPSIKVMLAQLNPVVGDVAENTKSVIDTLNNAQSQKVDLVVFPELYLTGYYFDDSEILTERAEEAFETIRPHTEDLVAIIGTPTTGEERPYNSAVIFENGEVIGTYNKTHLYGPEHSTFAAGDALSTFDTQIGTVGVEICYDLEFPEVARQLTLDGAEFLITISANMRPCERDQELYQGTRALENAVPHVLCNRVGQERNDDFFGNSAIVNERGRRIISLGADQAEITTAHIPTDPDLAKMHNYLGDRRPEIYSRD